MSQSANRLTPNNPDAVFQLLHRACEGLTFPSETDAPLQAFVWHNRDEAQQMLQHHPDDARIETQNLDEFFAPVLVQEDWFGDEENANLARFRELNDLMQQNLSEIQVFRIGETDITVYAHGRCVHALVGFQTRLVET